MNMMLVPLLKKVGNFICIQLLIVTSMAANAQAQHCPAVNCDCENIANHVWRGECRQHQALLRKSCIENGGKPTGYCRWHGDKAYPVALSIQYSPVERIDKQNIGEVEKKVESMMWSAREDLELAEVVLSRKEYEKVIFALKHYEKLQSDIHDLRRQVSESLIALDQSEDAKAYWQAAVRHLAETGDGAGEALKEKDFAQGQKQNAESIWNESLRAPKLDQQTRRLLRLLAMRQLKNAGNHLERLADASAHAGDPAAAARHMQQAAGLGELLLKWKVETNEKPVVVRYYLHQSAARWHSAANFWMATEATGNAEFALNEAQRILTGVNASSVADL